MHKPFKVVGLVSHTNPGKYRILSLGDVIPASKKQARKVGANGLIIDQTRTIKSGIIVNAPALVSPAAL